MKIQIASDLHHEMVQHRADLDGPLLVARETDVLVLAGDIHEGSRAIDRYSDCRVPVVYVTGNHEPHRHNYQQLLTELRERTQGTSVRFLQDDELILGNVRFLGATLWTDYNLYPLRLDDAMRAADAAVMEHNGSGNVRVGFLGLKTRLSISLGLSVGRASVLTSSFPAKRS